MRTIGAAKFKEQCLTLLDNLSSEGLVITKHGKPVAKLLPYGASSADLIGALRGKLKISGDVMTTGRGWNAVAEP
jgi:antitoxin (DNA-binding transcriptional repressor) of toxin-antitoxin stability system